MANIRRPVPPKPDLAPSLDNVTPLLDACSTMLQGWMTMNAAILDFAQSRIKQNLELGQALSSSKDLDQVVELQSGFVRTAVQEYVEQTDKMLKLGAKVAAECMTATQEGAKAPVPRERELGSAGEAKV